MQMKAQQSNPSDQRVNLDGFFFSCYEYEKTQKAQNNWPPANRWPSIKRDQRAQLVGKDLNSLIGELIRWYGNEHELVRNNPITVEDLYQFTVLTEFLLQDLGDLYFEMTQEDLHPMSPSEMSQHPFWLAVYGALREQFTQSYEYIYKYLTWNYSLPEKMNYNPNSLPPTGHNAPPPKSRISSNGQLIVPERRGSNFRSERNGNRQGRSFRSEGGEQDGNAARHSRHRRSERTGNGGRYENRDGNGMGGNQRGRGNRGGGRGDAAARERMENQALSAVADAIEHLTTNSAVEEIQLAPVNSFLRRMQHSEIATQGFFSHSIGEGENRAVMVTRFKANANEEE